MTINTRSQQAAAEALNTHRRIAGGDSEPLETRVSDLIADVLILAHDLAEDEGGDGVDLHEIVERGLSDALRDLQERAEEERQCPLGRVLKSSVENYATGYRWLLLPTGFVLWNVREERKVEPEFVQYGAEIPGQPGTHYVGYVDFTTDRYEIVEEA